MKFGSESNRIPTWLGRVHSIQLAGRKDTPLKCPNGKRGNAQQRSMGELCLFPLGEIVMIAPET